MLKYDKESSDVLNEYFHSVFNIETDCELLYFNDFAKRVFMDEVEEPFTYRGPLPRSNINDFQIRISLTFGSHLKKAYDCNFVAYYIYHIV